MPNPQSIRSEYVADPERLALLEDALIDAARPPGSERSKVARARRRIARKIAPR